MDFDYDENNILKDSIALIAGLKESCEISSFSKVFENSLSRFIPTNGSLNYIKNINKSLDLINTCPIDNLIFIFFILNELQEIKQFFKLYDISSQSKLSIYVLIL